MPDTPGPGDSPLTLSLAPGLSPHEVAALVHLDQERRWREGERLLVEAYLQRHPALRADPEVLLDLIDGEMAVREQCGDTPALEEYLARFPDQAERLRRHFRLHQVLRAGLVASPSEAATVPPPPSRAMTPAPRTVAAGSEQAAAPAPPGLSLPARELVPGYEILGELGRGGMGVVYKARQVRLNRLVALKMILAGAYAGEQERARFVTEAEAVARLQHPHIVQIFETGQHGGLPFFSLEFCPGGTLHARLADTPQPPAEAARVVEQLARGMAYAHQRGIVHRDLKPHNILLAEDGTPKITDFGLAKRLEGEPGSPAGDWQTATGAVMGTPSYMAPEQARGQSRAVGPAADVYALGAILYKCLTGRPPFQAASKLETLQQVRSQEPVPVRALQPKLPRDLETICLKCLQKEPRKRYGSAAELAEDLRRFQEGRPITARPVGMMERAARGVRRRPGVAALLGLVVLLTAAGLAGIAWAYGEAVRERNNARAEAANARLAEEAMGRQKEAAQQAEAQTRSAKEKADQVTEEATRQLANSQVMLADAAWREGAAGVAQERLDAVQGDLRRWEWRYLKRTTAGGLFTLRGHTGPVTGVCFSPDGRRLATGSDDQTVKVWDARTGQELLTLKGHTAEVTSLCFSADGRRLATGSNDQTAKVWDARTGQELLCLQGHAAEVTSVCFSPDGQRLATGSHDRTAMVWDVSISTKGQQAGGRLLLTLQGHHLPVSSVCFSPDGRRLATGSHDQRAKVWDARTGQELLSLKGHKERVLSVCFSPDGQRLATGGTEPAAKVWDVSMSTKGQQAGSTKGQQAGSTKGQQAGGQELLTLKGPDRGKEVYSLCFSPDGQRLASGSHDQTARVWDARTGRLLLTLRGHTAEVRSLCFSPDGQRLVSGSVDGTAKVWDARPDQEPLPLWGHTAEVTSVCFAPDSRRLVSGSADNTAKVWDTWTGQELLTLQGHTAVVFSVCFSPDGQRLATGSVDGTAKVWDARTGQELLSLKGDTDRVFSVCFSPDGQRLAAGGWDKTVKVWDARTGEALLTLQGHTDRVFCVCFSPDGQRLASGSWDKTVKVWDAHSGRELLTLQGHTDKVYSVGFSPDGQRLASGSFDGVAKVWDVSMSTKGQDLLTLKGHRDRVFSLCFSPDGQRLVSGSADKTVKVWDVSMNTKGQQAGSTKGQQAGGQDLLTLKGHTDWVFSVSFSPDGRRLVSGSLDGTAKVWDAREVTPVPDAEELFVRRARTRLDLRWHLQEAARQEGEQQWLAAAFHLEQSLTVHADAAVRDRLLRALTEAVRRQPERSSTWRRLALVQLQAGQEGAYCQTCRAMQQRFRLSGEIPQAVFLLGTMPVHPPSAAVAALLLHPAAPPGAGLCDRLQTLRAAVLRPGTLADPESWLAAVPPEEKLLRGAVLCRAGKHADAVAELASAQEPVALLFRALAEHGRGNGNAARQALAEALQLLPPEQLDLVEHTPPPWEQRVESDGLRREVEALLAAK